MDFIQEQNVLGRNGSSATSRAVNILSSYVCFFFQAEDGIRDLTVTGVQTCALPISQIFQQIGEHLAVENLRRIGGNRAAGKHVQTRDRRMKNRLIEGCLTGKDAG